MKPYPLFELNHFTVPLATSLSRLKHRMRSTRSTKSQLSKKKPSELNWRMSIEIEILRQLFEVEWTSRMRPLSAHKRHRNVTRPDQTKYPKGKSASVNRRASIS